MKKSLFVSIAVLSLTACQFAELEDQAESASTTQPVIVTPENSNTISINKESDIFVVDSATSSLTLTGNLEGKTIYYAAVNTTNRVISNEYVRYVASGNARSAASYASIIEEEESAEDEFNTTSGMDFFPEFESSSSRAAGDSSGSEVKKLALNNGVTTKKIFVSTSSNAYEKKTATLYAFNEICNVWVINDDPFLNTAAKRSEIARIYAQKFALVYPMIHNIFGKESDFLYSSVRGDKQHMNEVNDTGSKVNIVIYDLYNDGNDSNHGGTLGLFSSMDYYKNGLAFSNVTVSRSNEGKFFYIDSYFATTLLDYTVSTLAHEFQHMINFSVKAMNGKASDSNFNEMLSMLCEDLMQDVLKVDDAYSPKNRIRKFLESYYKAGIREYDSTLQSYANAYAFGAWLIRNYGGAALVKEMMSNGKANNDCIASAVNSINGSSYSFNDLIQEFVKACFNQKFYSPRIFENNQITDIASSYGIFLKNYGRVAKGENSVTLNFASESGKTSSGLLMYVYVK